MSDPLPTWDECDAAKKAGADLTALQEFIIEQEPAGQEKERFFREGLAAVVKEASQGALRAALALLATGSAAHRRIEALLKNSEAT